MDSLQPTVLYDSSASEPKENTFDVSRANVGFVVGDRPHFSDETSTLLRRRLSAAALVISIVLFAAFLGNLVTGVVTSGYRAVQQSDGVVLHRK